MSDSIHSDSSSSSRQEDVEHPRSESRRAFLGVSGGAAAVLALGGSGSRADAQTKPAAAAQPGSPPSAVPSYDERFRRRTVELRQSLARDLDSAPIPSHPNNGDQQRYANAIGSDTRGLPHNA